MSYMLIWINMMSILQFTDSDAHSPMNVPIAVVAEAGNHSGIGWRTKYSSDYGRCYSLDIGQEGRFSKRYL